MLSILAALFGALFALAVAVSLGRLLFRSSEYSTVDQLATGSVVLSAMVFGTLCAGVAGPVAFAVAGVVAIGSSIAFAGMPKLGVPRFTPAYIAAALFGVVYLVHALAPEIQPDAIGYHLTLVSEFIRTGAFPDHVGFYEMLPQGAETLFAFAFAFGHHSAAKLLHFAFLCATTPVLIRIARRLGLPEWTAPVAAALYFVSPIAGIDGSSAYTDAMLAFFSLEALEFALADKAVASGLCAGFCYAIKLPGAIAIAVVVAIFVARRKWIGAAIAGGVASVAIAPWLIRDAVLAGNPLAPFANGLFPNDYFHRSMEADVFSYVRRYASTSWRDLPWDLCVRGEKAQGLLGPAFLVLPIALLALRNRAGRILLMVAAVFAIPWFINPASRFLIPALPLLALALVTVLPRRAALALLAVHAFLSWPAIVRVYASPHAWTLGHLPWRAALRLEPAQQYLHRTLWSTEISDFINEQTQPGEHVLDFAALPTAYTHWTPIGYWESAAGERITRALEIASQESQFYEVEVRWPQQQVRALRFEPARASTGALSIQELEFAVPPSREWLVDADPYPAEGPLALDRNLASGWNTWESARPGMYLEVRFGHTPVSIEGARVVLWGEDIANVNVFAQTAGDTWNRLPANQTGSRLRSVDIRRSAVRLVRNAGIRLIVLPEDKDFGPIARALSSSPEAWGVSEISRIYEIHVFRIN